MSDGDEFRWSCHEPAYEEARNAARAAAKAMAGGAKRPDVDMINSPPHYTGATFHGQSIEPIDVAESFGLIHNNYRATAFYYIVRAGKKGPAIEDLKKAQWWIAREIAALEGDKK